MQRVGWHRGLFVVACLLWTASAALAQERLKLAVGQRGAWETSVSELGQDAGIFRKHGLALEILYTQGTGETQQIVISGAADIGIAAGTFGAMGSFAKGAPVRVIGATMTGGNDLFWYVPSGSPIRSIADTAGRTVGYSTSGSSTHQTVLAFGKHFHVDLKPVAVGGPPSAFTQVMSGQVDVGWAVLPFGIQALDEGRIRIIAKASDIPRFRDQTIRVVLANASALNARRDVFVRYMRAYREALDWMYADPAAANGYAKLASIPAEAARRVIELSPREDFDPDRFGGLDSLMSDALQFKFLAAPLTKDQLGELIQIPFR